MILSCSFEICHFKLNDQRLASLCVSGTLISMTNTDFLMSYEITTPVDFAIKFCNVINFLFI